MRFDYRGMGDSSGKFPGLEREHDIQAAISSFIENVPGMSEVVLYGGCDAASAIAIHGWRFPEVSGWILANPWVYTEEENARVMMKYYYLERLMSRDFWKKIFRFKFDIKASLISFLKIRETSKKDKDISPSEEIDPMDISAPFDLRMFAGWEKFNGRVLILKAERSIVAKEFDSYVEQSPQRKKILARENVEQITIKDADHAFSVPKARDALFQSVSHWVESLLST
jgi:exosortase A-associated hydrolase 1